jgi:hypothetical protein
MLSGWSVILFSAPATTFAENCAADKPATAAAAVWVPAVVPKVHCAVACPLPSVAELTGVMLPAETVQVTVTPATPAPAELMTFATRVAGVVVPADTEDDALLLTA